MNINHSDLEGFVDENKESLRKLLLYTPTDVVGRQSGETRIHNDVIQKWYPIMGNFSSYPNLPAKYKNLMYLYAEILALFLTRVTSQHLLDQFSKDNLKNSGAMVLSCAQEALDHLLGVDNRSAIVGKCYNYLTGKVEYVLEDGNHLPVDMTNRPEMVIDDSRLPGCVLMIIDPQVRRAGRIKEIDA